MIRTLVSLLAVGTWCEPAEIWAQEEKRNVEMTLDYEEKFKPGFSLIWSPCGQAAWDMMRRFHKVKAILLEPVSRSAEVMNAFQWEPNKVLPPGTYVFGGMDSPVVREEVREQVRRIAGPNAAAMIGDSQPPGPIAPGVERHASALFLSCLAQKTSFPGRFIPDAKPRVFFGAEKSTTLAKGFGCTGPHSATYAQNFIVLKDDLKGTAVLKLALHSDTPGLSQSLVLLQHPQLSSIGQGLNLIRDALKNPLPELSIVESGEKSWRYTHQLLEGDRFWMPYLKASLIGDFTDLIGRSYLRKDDPNHTDAYTEWRIREAQQFLNLNLGHEGVLVEAVFKVEPDFLSIGGSSSKPEVNITQLPEYPKSFVFNKPFLATLWLKDADWPYLACWVDGPALLKAQ
jgi:hypothetical protein